MHTQKRNITQVCVLYRRGRGGGLGDTDCAFGAICVVCSTTIWVGHIPKSVAQNQIAEAFEDFGTVKSVDVSKRRSLSLLLPLIKYVLVVINFCLLKSH